LTGTAGSPAVERVEGRTLAKIDFHPR
jgi:hypothetical protein